MFVELPKFVEFTHEASGTTSMFRTHDVIGFSDNGDGTRSIYLSNGEEFYVDETYAEIATMLGITE